MQPDAGLSPFNHVPLVVVAPVAVIAVVELVLSLAAGGLIGGPSGIGWRITAIQDWGFSPAVWEMTVEKGARDWTLWRRFASYGAVHGSTTHALFAAALMLALGKFVAEVFRGPATLIVMLAGLLAGAAAFGLFIDGLRPLFGAYPAVYALIGAYTHVVWRRLGDGGGNRLAAFRMIGVLMALQLLFGVIYGADPVWVAELAGFAAGFVLSFVLRPGGVTNLRDRIRAR